MIWKIVVVINVDYTFDQSVLANIVKTHFSSVIVRTNAVPCNEIVHAVFLIIDVSNNFGWTWGVKAANRICWWCETWLRDICPATNVPNENTTVAFNHHKRLNALYPCDCCVEHRQCIVESYRVRQTEIYRLYIKNLVWAHSDCLINEQSRWKSVDTWRKSLCNWAWLEIKRLPHVVLLKEHWADYDAAVFDRLNVNVASGLDWCRCHKRCER